jgi:signal peptidase I
MRTIGLPHDVVRIVNGKVFVNDRELIEPYVMMKNNQRLTFQMPGEYVVPEYAYFVMGDNRDNSNDSRFWGFVPENNIYGSVESIWCSFNFDQNEEFSLSRRMSSIASATIFASSVNL